MASETNETSLDARLARAGIGLTLDEQRQKIIDERFGGDATRYHQATKLLHRFIWDWLDKENIGAPRFITQQHRTAGTGTEIAWVSNRDGAIMTSGTTPSGRLVAARITPDDTLTKGLWLPSHEELPHSLAHIGMGLVPGQPHLQAIRLELQSLDYENVVVPDIADVLSEAGLPGQMMVDYTFANNR